MADELQSSPRDLGLGLTQVEALPHEPVRWRKGMQAVVLQEIRPEASDPGQRARLPWLLEEDGIYWYSQHKTGEHKLVLVDEPSFHLPATGELEPVHGGQRAAG